jgi:FtsZ-binding cell division protein ZapB
VAQDSVRRDIMRVFNKDKTVELTEYDKSKGYLVNDKLLVAHHERVLPQNAEWHYEVVKEYSNGGKVVEKVIDKPAVMPRDPYDEYEDIQVYIPYTAAELAEIEIFELKQKLYDTDYQAIKYAEGFLTEEEYAEMKAQRQAWRERINELEAVIGGGV